MMILPAVSFMALDAEGVGLGEVAAA